MKSVRRSGSLQTEGLYESHSNPNRTVLVSNPPSVCRRHLPRRPAELGGARPVSIGCYEGGIAALAPLVIGRDPRGVRGISKWKLLGARERPARAYASDAGTAYQTTSFAPSIAPWRKRALLPASSRTDSILSEISAGYASCTKSLHDRFRTKAGFNRDDRGPSLSRATILEEAAVSLERLKTDRIDLHYAHADMRADPLAETLSAFNDLVVSGKAHAIGCSSYRAWRIAESRALSEKLGIAEYCCVQQRHTYLRPCPGSSFAPQTSSNEDLLDYCRERSDFRPLAYSPLLSGAYSREDREIPVQYRGTDADTRLAVLRRVANEAGGTVSQVIYAWMLSSSPRVIPLTAPLTMEQLRENLGGFTLTSEQIKALDTAGNP